MDFLDGGCGVEQYKPKGKRKLAVNFRINGFYPEIERACVKTGFLRNDKWASAR